ncbi:gamma-glutamyltransferase [Roseospirillum parvum]|nr:gamma-glutamyltransferase [Roseospirillum parvum]
MTPDAPLLPARRAAPLLVLLLVLLAGPLGCRLDKVEVLGVTLATEQARQAEAAEATKTPQESQETGETGEAPEAPPEAERDGADQPAAETTAAPTETPPDPEPAEPAGSDQPAPAVEPPTESAGPRVAVADRRAAEAALEMLAAGGSAVDATIAAAMVLTLVEPQSSGLGGGAFLLHWDAASQSLSAWDGRETAPAAATPKRFLGPDGDPLPFPEAMVGGLSVGVPGQLAMLEALHRESGRLPWADLFAPAIHLAENGFEVSPRLAAMIAGDRHLASQPRARRYFFQRGADGTLIPHPAGSVLTNRDLATTFRLIARHGAKAFYEGEIATSMVATVAEAARPGDLSLVDLATYKPKRRDPLCRGYRTVMVCTMPPPTSGGVATLQMLGILSHFDVPAMRPDSVLAAHLLVEAGHLAFADRNRYLGDPEFVEVPVETLLDSGYLETRAARIRLNRSLGRAAPGELAALPPRGAGLDRELPSTSHLSIVDQAGNVVSMTASVETAFGSRLMTRGFLLNNQLTDFSFRPTDAAGRPLANAVAGGKRPRSSMAPTIVLGPDRQPMMVLGSPGGSRIIAYVAQTLVGLIDWRLDAQAAVALPHVAGRNRDLAEIEDERLRRPLEAIGHRVERVEMTSGLNILLRDETGWHGAADPRREGVVLPPIEREDSPR